MSSSSSSSSLQHISTQINLFGTQIQGINNTFTLFRSQSNQQWMYLLESLSNMKLSLQQSLQQLQSKENSLKDLEKKLELKEEQLISTENRVRLMEKQLHSTEKFVCDRCKTLGVKVSEIGNVIVNIEPSSECIDIDDDENCGGDASIKLIITLDGKSLQIFLNDKFEMHEFIGEEIKSAIKLSNNPAKLVLDAMLGFFPPHLKKEKLEYEGSVVRSSCVVLLEQLLELKPKIKKAVREEARALAEEWWEKVKVERGDHMVVLGFLLLIVVYDVWSGFDRNELRSLGEVVPKHRVVGELKSRIWFFRKCGDSSMAPTFQKGECCTSPVKTNMASPVQEEGPFAPPEKFGMGPTAQKREHYSFPVKDSRASQTQKEGPCSPPVKFRNAPTVVNGEHYNYTWPVKSSMASSVQKEGPSIPPVNFNMAPPVQKKEPYAPAVTYASVSPSAEYSVDLDTSCTSITKSGLKSYLIKNVKDLNLCDEKVLECLQYASDAAKLVFDLVQDFYLGLDGIHGDTSMSCCVFLLEHLKLVSPHITTLLKNEVMNFAARWKARLSLKNTKHTLVFGFLKFLITYKLSGCFKADEIFSLFTVLYERDDAYTSDQIYKLCSALGLEEKIPEFVQSLIKEKKQLEAVRYICTFRLTDKFPPQPLLKDYLDHTNETAFETCKNINDPIKAQNKAASEQIRALQNVLNCIFEFKLDFECSPIDLQHRIRQLEQEKKERKSLKLRKDMTGKNNTSAPNELGSWSDCRTSIKRAVLPTDIPSQNLSGHSQEKRRCTDTTQNSDLPNGISPIDLEMDLSPPSPRSPTALFP